MSSTATTMETTPTGSTAEAGLSPGGKPSNVSAVIKPTERAGACFWLKVWSRGPMERRTSAAKSVSVKRVAMADVAAIEISVVEAAAIDDRSAVRDVGVVVVDH